MSICLHQAAGHHGVMRVCVIRCSAFAWIRDTSVLLDRLCHDSESINSLVTEWYNFNMRFRILKFVSPNVSFSHNRPDNLWSVYTIKNCRNQLQLVRGSACILHLITDMADHCVPSC